MIATTHTLLDKMEMTSLENRIQDMLMLVYKSLNSATPVYIATLFTAKINGVRLRGINNCSNHV